MKNLGQFFCRKNRLSRILRTSAIIIFLALNLLNITAVRSIAIAVPTARPLHESADKASIVVIARLDRYTEDSLTEQGIGQDGKPILESLFGRHVIQKSGIYEFHAVRTLKGTSISSFSIHMPGIVDFPYRDESLKFRPNEDYLLLLTHLPDGTLYPVDHNLPLIPIVLPAQESSLLKVNTNDIFSNIIDTLLISIKSEKFREDDAFIIRHVVDAKLVAGLSPYLQDKDLKTQDNILCALIVNQQVTAIPMAINLERETYAKSIGSEAYLALRTLKTPEAVPYLNPLVFSPLRSTREVAISLLDDLEDQSSIPYLILATRDPDARYLGYIAYLILYQHQQVSSLGTRLDRDYFVLHTNDVLSTIQVWWSSELMGKHLSSDQQLSPSEKMASLETLDGQNKALFKPYPSLRQEAIGLLDKKADKSSIPYLVLALQDPDAKVSYQAYKLLLRLTGVSTVPVSESVFETNGDAAKAPLYVWWADELNGKHRPASG